MRVEIRSGGGDTHDQCLLLAKRASVMGVGVSAHWSVPCVQFWALVRASFLPL